MAKAAMFLWYVLFVPALFCECVARADEGSKSSLKWKDRPLHVLMIGKTGVGKSALANALLVGTEHKEIFQEGAYEATTKVLHSETTDINGVKVVVHDTPGFFDGEITTGELLIMLREGLPQIDLVIFCAKIDDTRIRSEDKEMVSLVAALLTPDLWSRAVLALTFSNKVPSSRYVEMLRCRTRQYQNLLDQASIKVKFPAVHSSLLSDNINITMAEKGPVILPVGYRSEANLPDGKNWLSELWLSCFEAVDADAAPAFLKMGAFTRKDIKLDVKQNERLVVKFKDVFGAGAFAAGSTIALQAISPHIVPWLMAAFCGAACPAGGFVAAVQSFAAGTLFGPIGIALFAFFSLAWLFG
jgi:hypothetical protein